MISIRAKTHWQDRVSEFGIVGTVFFQVLTFTAAVIMNDSQLKTAQDSTRTLQASSSDSFVVDDQGWYVLHPLRARWLTSSP
jgi:hypothetical protein